MEAAPERKLTTLLAADVAGYSRLMGADEPGMLATLKTYREAILREIDEHRGRVVNTAGDSMLAEFSSVVNAVDCAVRIQRDLAERNATLPESRRMLLRIGVNLGDVMVDGGDLFGEGINIAARLQEIAEPGGVLVSGSVFEQVRNKLSLGFDYLGAQTVKNIADAVPAYRVVLGESAEPAAYAIRHQAVEEDGPHARPRLTQAQRLKRRAAFWGVIIAAMFTINIMSWNGYPWFLWPTLGIVVIFALRSIAGWR